MYTLQTRARISPDFAFPGERGISGEYFFSPRNPDVFSNEFWATSFTGKFCLFFWRHFIIEFFNVHLPCSSHWSHSVKILYQGLCYVLTLFYESLLNLFWNREQFGEFKEIRWLYKCTMMWIRPMKYEATLLLFEFIVQ